MPIRIILTFLCLALLSCVRQDVVPYQRNQNSKLVLVGFLTPGVQINVFVGKTQPFGKESYQNTNFMETGAKVILSNSKGKQQNLTLASSNPSVYTCLQSDFAIEPGETYTIQVSNEITSVWAKTTVPLEKAIWKNTFFKTIEQFGNGFYDTSFSGSWDEVNKGMGLGYDVAFLKNGKFISYANKQNIKQNTSTYFLNNEDFYLKNDENSLDVLLLTNDAVLTKYSKTYALTIDIEDSLKGGVFSDFLTSFKGVLSNETNIQGGAGIFGSFLKTKKTVYR